VFAPVVYRAVSYTCRRLFHLTPPKDSPLLRRQAARPGFYLGQAKLIDAYLEGRGLAAQMPLLAGLRGLEGEGLSASAAAGTPELRV